MFGLWRVYKASIANKRFIEARNVEIDGYLTEESQRSCHFKVHRIDQDCVLDGFYDITDNLVIHMTLNTQGHDDNDCYFVQTATYHPSMSAKDQY